MASTPASTAQAESPEAAVARALGRILWELEFRATNPGATQQAKQAAWNVAKRDRIRAGRQVAARMAKAGFVITPPAQSTES